MRISLFGNLRISFAGRPVTAVNTNRLQSLIAYLILHGDVPQPRERLAFMLWPASSESQARTNLRQLLHHLKRALPAECNLLVTDHFAVQWRQDASCTDRRRRFSGGDRGGRLRAKRRKIARGRYNPSPPRRNFMKTTFCLLSTTTGSRHCAKTTGGGSPRCCTVSPSLFEEQKEYAAAIPCAERLVALDSLCEAHHQLLIRLHAANHDRASALRAYHQCMRVLRREMGVEPGAATQELFERILKAEPGASRELPSDRPVSRGEAGLATAESAGTGWPHDGMASVGIGLAIGGGGRSASGRNFR